MGWIKQENVKIEEGKRGVDGIQDLGNIDCTGARRLLAGLLTTWKLKISWRG